MLGRIFSGKMNFENLYVWFWESLRVTLAVMAVPQEKFLESTHCNTLQHTATIHFNCNTLQQTCKNSREYTLQHTATHCNTLSQHTSTATHCNILQHACKNSRKSALYPCHVLSKKSCKMNVEFSEFLPAPVVMAVPRVEILKTHLASNFTTWHD